MKPLNKYLHVFHSTLYARVRPSRGRGGGIIQNLYVRCQDEPVGMQDFLDLDSFQCDHQREYGSNKNREVDQHDVRQATQISISKLFVLSEKEKSQRGDTCGNVIAPK